MRTAQKQDVLELIDTLYQAQNEIKKNIESKNYVFAQDMLAQCQECAVSIGTIIEDSEGEGFVTVSYIEEYCDILYRIHEELNVSEEISANKIYKTLRKYLLKMENSIKNDVPVKKEMVFLPYKASMWDSLESVWRAADADPECDAYVVPIPYYDKNPDGSLGREHYEGNAFPPGVPIVHYKKYDIAKRHPDAIFIHNPYDNYNYVTSVHPSFYTDKLKEYCEKLIYIPYYVSAETNPDAPEVMEAKVGFVLSGGVLNSDMVIVQSENTKKLYINILEKHFPEVNHNYWEQKIQGLGSPKLDRVSSVQRDDSKLPQRWREIIYTKTHIRKRTILYNISIAALLGNADMLEKIKDVLDFFKNNQDVALWWRPHPLYESTLASMRPALLREYREITERYKEEAWGIFDEGVDLEWAIAETDAYYGDSSSVVQLYKEVGKPVMYQNVSVRTGQEIKAEDIPIWPSAFCVDGDDIWFVHGKMNVLMRYSMSEEYTYILGAIFDKVVFQEKLYCGIHKWENKLFLIPCWAKEIIVYEIENGRFERIFIDRSEEYNSKILFIKSYMKEETIYCVPCYYHAIVRIDVKSNQISYTAIELNMKRHINDAVWVNNKIIGIYSCTNMLLFYDSETDLIELKKLENTERQYNRITNIDNLLYLFDTFTHAIFEISGEKYDERKICDTSYDGVGISAISSKLFLVDSAQNYEMQIVNLKGEVVFRTESNCEVRQEGLYPTTLVGIMNNASDNYDLFYFSVATYNMNHLKCGKLEKQFNMHLSYDEFHNLKKMCIQKSYFNIDESNIYDLVTWVKNLRITVKKELVVKQGCGQKILQAIKEGRTKR